MPALPLVTWALLTAALLLTAPAALALSGTWTADASGNWSDTTKWSGGTVADGAGNTADFSTINITANRTVTLDTDRTIGLVQFKDTSQNQTWTLSGNFALALDNGTNAPKVRGLNNTSFLNVVLAGTNGVASPDQIGTVVFNGVNTYTGQTAIYRGTLRVGNTNALPGGSRAGEVVMYQGGNANDFPQLDLDVFNITINGLSSAVSNTTSTTVPKVTSLSGSAGTSTLTLGDNNASGSYDGTIANGATRTVALKKIGTGTQMLNGTNTYSGGTTVSGGTLVLNGVNSGTGTLTASGGGMLAGTGPIAALVSVSWGGAISPGSGAGSMTLSGGLAVGGGGGAYVWDLAAHSTNNPGTDFDQIVVAGGSLSLGPSRLCIRFTGTATAPDASDAFWQSPRSWKIISLNGGANPTKANFALIENGTYPAGNFTTSLDGSNNVVLTFTPGGLAPTVVDLGTATSRPFASGARGQCPYRSANDASYTAMFSMSQPSLMRGIAGGLDADTYDWRIRQSGSKWGATAWGTLVTSLDYLRKCRDTGSEPLFTANMFGGGYTNGYGTWVCQFDNHSNLFNPGGYGTNAVTGTAAQLAADWVRYCNILVQAYRQGQESLIGSDPSFNAANNAENLRVYNSVKLGGDWRGRDVLPANGEAAVPKVIWWEVGNEPEVDLAADSTLVTQHVIADKIVFRDRYRVIANAMKAVDSSIETGPCITIAANGNEWLGRVAEDTNAPLDFVGVHPYMSSLKWSYPNPTNLTTSLLDIGRFLADHNSGTALTLSNYGGATRFGTKPASWYWDTPLIASEWNPVNWDATSAVKSSMASGLGTVESCFRYAHPNRTVSALPSWFGANYWEDPAGVVSLTNAFVALRDFAGDLILENPAPGPQPVPDFAPPGWPLRMYLTRQTNGANKLHVWGLNFSESQDHSVNFVLTNLPFTVGQVIRRSFGKPGAENSLTNATGLGWTVQDVTGSVDPSNFTFTVENASFAILTFQEKAATNWYWDTSMSVGLQGGSGTWGTNRFSGFWSTTPAGENPMLAWADGRGAVFAAALSAGGTITVTGTVSPRSLIVNKANCNFTGSGTVNLGNEGMQINAPVQLSGGPSNPMLTGTGGVVVNPGAANTVSFNGTNTFTGDTLIASGTLTLGSGGSISNTARIILSNAATFNVSAKTAGFVLQSWQALGGSGSVTGRVTAYGTVSPGASVGTLSFSTNLILAGTTVMEVSRNGTIATNDTIICARTLTYGGTLIVTNAGPDPLVDGDTFRLFNAATNVSAFSATNLPSPGDGFRWDTSGLATGVVKVVYVGLGRPEFQTASLTGTNLILGGTNGIVGMPYYLLTSTNITLPLTDWTRLQTNVFGPGGSFSNSVPVEPEEPSRFHQLQQAN
jgi:autotransporter-associated beta strand protein